MVGSKQVKDLTAMDRLIGDLRLELFPVNVSIAQI